MYTFVCGEVCAFSKTGQESGCSFPLRIAFCWRYQLYYCCQHQQNIIKLYETNKIWIYLFIFIIQKLFSCGQYSTKECFCKLIGIIKWVHMVRFVIHCGFNNSHLHMHTHACKHTQYINNVCKQTMYVHSYKYIHLYIKVCIHMHTNRHAYKWIHLALPSVVNVMQELAHATCSYLLTS